MLNQKKVKTLQCVCAALVLSCFAGACAADSFTTKAPMISARSEAESWALQNGKVLVAAGQGTSGSISVAEIYDPANNTWTSTGTSLNGPHSRAASVLLTNGLAMIMGGNGISGATGIAEAYDATNDTWVLLAPMKDARSFLTATLLQNGTVLTTGGSDASAYSTVCEIYDPAANTWTLTGSLNTGRYGHTATLLPNGEVLVTGGYDSGGFSGVTELYNPLAGTWSVVTPLNAPRSLHRATLLPNGKVLAVGGVGTGGVGGFFKTAELYDPVANTWTFTSVPMTNARERHSQTLLPDGRVLLAGGYNNTQYTTASELYDPQTDTFASTSVPLNAARFTHNATRLTSGDVLISGGQAAGGSVASVELYTTGNPPTAQTITIVAGDMQSAPVGSMVFPPTVQVVYQPGNDVGPGVAVTFSVNSGGGSVTGAATVTDANGIAQVGSWTLGTTTGSNTLQVLSPAAPSILFNATATAGPAAIITVTTGNNQSAVVNTNVAVAPTVTVQDSFNNFVANTPVTFAVATGGGSVTGGSAMTNATGSATLGSWTLGSFAGSNTLSVTSGGAPAATVNATGTAGGATLIAVIAGDTQSATVNTAIAIAPSVRVFDQFDNVIPNTPVTFVVTAGGGSVTGGSAMTDASGTATLGSWTLGKASGSNTLAVTSGAAAATLSATATPDVAASLLIAAGNNQIARPDALVSLAPAVKVVDQFGNAVALNTPVVFSVATGGGSITGANATTNAAGIATVGSWKLGPTTGPNTLTAKSGAAPSKTFNATAANGIPVITLFSTNDNPGLIGTPVTYSLSATDSDTSVLNYSVDFGDGTSFMTGSFAQATTVAVAHTYTTGGSFTVTVSVTDGGTTVMQTAPQTIPIPPSVSDGLKNISDNTFMVVNPINNIGIEVTDSNGGIIQLGIDVSSLIRSDVDVTTDFGDISGRTSKVGGTRPVHQYVQHGIFVAKTTVVSHATGELLGLGRKTLVISARETGEKLPSIEHLKSGRAGVGVAPSKNIALRNIQGKFIYSAKTNDTASFSGIIQLPAGLDLSQPHEFSVALGNVVCNTTIDARGAGSVPGSPAILRNLKVSFPHLPKGALTTGGESARIDVTMYTAGLIVSGFDTEGIVKNAKDAPSGVMAPRKIQVGMLLDGVPYESLTPTGYTSYSGSDFGVISGRTQK